jgi:ABC-type multidrug transport system permease subunit
MKGIYELDNMLVAFIRALFMTLRLKGISNLVYALLTVPLVLILSVAIFNQFTTNVDRAGWTAQANQTFEKVTTSTYSGFNLGSMLPFIIIAVTIVGIILGMIAAK